MLGIYIWALFIIIIAIAATGWEVVLFPVIGVTIWLLIALVIDRWNEKRDLRRSQIDREKAIDEWERKWHRKHQARK